MNEQEIRKYLSDNNFVFHILDCVDSTNTYLRSLCENGAENKTVVIANEQTQGRGRRGKTFFSPANSGIYMSILIMPDFSIENPAKVTIAAAVAVCRAIKKVFDFCPQIKWVNDVYLDNKKVCGILTERISAFDNIGLNPIILGIGINLSKPANDYPSEIRDIAAPILSCEIVSDMYKERLIAEVINEFFDIFSCDESSIYKEYKDLLFIIGKKINVIGMDNFSAEVLDLAEDYSLVIKKEDGNIFNISSGEISIKLD